MTNRRSYGRDSDDLHRLFWFDSHDARRRRVRHYISTVDIDEDKLTDGDGHRCGATLITASRSGGGEVYVDAAEQFADHGELVVHEWCHAALRCFGGLESYAQEETIAEHMAPHLWALMRGAGMRLPKLPAGAGALGRYAKARDRAEQNRMNDEEEEND